MPGFIVWFLANLPVAIPIALSIVSTLITGLTNFPKAEGFLKTVLWWLNLLSVVPHSNSPGTFKLPILQSQEPGTVVNVIGIAKATES